MLRVPLGVIAQPLAPAFWSSHSCIWLRRSPRPLAGTAILIRTGNRRSASAIISLELAAILLPPRVAGFLTTLGT